MEAQPASSPVGAGAGSGAAARRPPLLRYAVAVLLPPLGLGLTVVLLAGSGVRLPPMDMFYLAVVGGAWFGGLGPGLVATLLSVLLAQYVIFPPTGRLAVAADAVPALAAFTGASVLISLMTGSLHRARRQAEAERASGAELAREVAERERAERSLRESEARLNAFLGQLPVGVGMIDRDGRWTIRNEAIGRFVRERIPSREPGDTPRWRTWAADGSPIDPSDWPGARALRGEATPGMDFLHRRDDGSELWTRVSAAPFRDDAGKAAGAIVVIEDIDEQKRAAARLDAVGRIAQELLRHAALDDVLHELLDQVRGALRVDEATILLDRDDGMSLSVRAARGMEEASARAVRIPVGRGVAGRVAATRQPMVIPDLSAVEVFRPALREAVHSLLAVPLLIDSRVIGVLHGGTSTRRDFTAEDRAFLELVAERVASIIERARLHEAERAARAEAEEARRAAEAAREEAEAANRAKADFLAAMSHDLRTPLTAIAGYAQLLEMGVHGPVNERQREALIRIAQNQQRVLGLLNELLGFARVEARRVEYRMEELALAPVLASLEATIAPQVQQTDLAYRYRPCDPALVVRADREKMEQVLLNLLSNAVKFTDPGGRITVEAEAEGDRVAIHVRDSGRGIPTDRLASVFEPFVQVGGPTGREGGGVGLGLAISLELARGMGGDLTAESVVGDGSTFTLRVPRAAAPFRGVPS